MNTKERKGMERYKRRNMGENVRVKIRGFVGGLYFKTPYIRYILNKFGVRSRVEEDLSSPRSCFEYPWVFKNLDLEKGRILDVGSVGSTLPFILASLGYDVHSVDIKEFTPLGLPHLPNIKFIRGDIRRTPFPDKFFDFIIAVSTIEHIGIRQLGD